MNERIEKIRSYLREEKLGCLLVDSPFDILYLLHIEQSFNYIELNLVLLITADNLFLIATPISLSAIEEYLPEPMNVVEADTSIYVANRSRYLKEVHDIIEKEQLESIGLTSVQYVDVSDKCVRVENPIPFIAAIKSEEEIQYIQESASILKTVYQKIIPEIKTGCGEIELRNRIDVELHNAGSERRAFPTRVAFGKKTASIFPVSTMDRLKEHDIVTIDMGGMHRGYIAEMGRTVFHGEIDATAKTINEIVLTAYQKVIDFLKPGIVASSVDAIARGYFEEMGHSQYFFHVLGESTGLVKGGIALAPNDRSVIKPGMVFVIEPGLSIPGWGGVKIKETVLITEEGVEELCGGPE
jgi:Xaa-Pro aminopeptidase